MNGFNCEDAASRIGHRTVAVGVLLLSGLLSVGCPSSDEPASAREMAEKLGVENPTGERIAEQVTSAVPRTAVKAEIAVLRGAIATHRRTLGSYPASLDELEPSVRLTFPDEYDYDAESGEVESRSYPDL